MNTPTLQRLTLSVLLLLAVVACGKRTPQEAETPVYDFQQMSDSGTLTALTLSGSMSYFMYKGEAFGYEYELLDDFARAHNLMLAIKTVDNETLLTEQLLAGEGDIVAYNIPITFAGKEEVLYCGREVTNEMVLVQPSVHRDSLIRDVIDLIGKKVYVIGGSKYEQRLINLNNELGGGIIIRTIDQDTISVEDLIQMVSAGDIPLTVSDADMAKLNKTYYPRINISLKISHPQRASWAVRPDTPGLAAAVDEWFAQNANSPSYRAIVKRYFEMSKLPGDAPAPIVGPGQISPFDAYFKQYAPEIAWDWRLLASIAYQESKFYTDRVSWAGATGLMGLMPRTAEAFGLSTDSLSDPKGSIRTAVAFIKRLNRSFSFIDDEQQRIKFILASYNGGSGHIYDAQALAEKYGKDPQVWEGNVEEYLRLKSLPEYYNDSVCKHGYFRGKETINYVRQVVERWHYYQEKVR